MDILRIAGFSALALLALAVLWGWASSSIILRGRRDALTARPATFGLPCAEESFRSLDGLGLQGWFIPASQPVDTTLVVCHGWGSNRSDVLERTHFLRTRGGHNLFYFDFRNHGESGSGLSSLTRLEIGDLEGALAHLRAAHPREAARTALYGMSMGGAVALWVAAQDPGVAGVAAESPFAEFNDVLDRYGRLYYNVPSFPFARITRRFLRWRLGFDPQAWSPVFAVRRIAPRPVLLVQGDRDARMPALEGEKLYAAAREPKTLWTLRGADHGDVAELGGADFENRLLAFYRDAFARAGTSVPPGGLG